LSELFPTVDFPNPDDEALRRLLRQARRIAVVGLSPKPHRDSNRVGRYLIGHGYEVVPIYPREEEILEQRVYRRLEDIPGKIDLVDVFRRREELAPVFDDAVAAGAPAIWTQYGCIDVPSARRARAAGLTVVMDLCLMVEHARLLGA
jgi:predicted CoA-binding protein